MKHLIVFLALFLACGVAQAQVPRKISYQGVLTDNAGNLVADGSYNFVFNLYSVATLGSPLWTETQNSIPVSRGGFSVLLGNVTPLNLPFGGQYWLGIAVNGGAELTPRVQLASSPYAVRADTSRAVQLPFSAFVTQTGVAPFTLQNNGGGVPAIVGQTNSNSANSYGLRGVSGGSSPAPTSAGVRGENFANDSFSAGIWGSQNGQGRGVYGFAPSGSGIYGESTTGAGVYGLSLSGSAILGALGASPGNGASAVRGNAGSANGANTVGVWGQNDGGGTGVFGQCATGTGASGNSSSGTGVWGSTSTGVGLVGTSAAGGTAARLNSGSATGTALEIQQGTLKVGGAGLNTTTAAFYYQTSAGASSCGTHCSIIDNALCNGDPTAILIVTPVEQAQPPFPDFLFAIAYCSGFWSLCTESGGSMPAGARFNVLVIKTH